MLLNSEQKSKQFWEHVKLHLNNSEFFELQQFCLKKENSSQIVENGWNLLMFLMNYLKEKKVNKNSFENFETIFIYITSISNSKEIFLSLLEQFDPMIDSDLVQLLFSALTKCCNDLIKRKLLIQSSNFEMLFSTLSYYVESLNLPNYSKFEPQQNDELPEEKMISEFLLKCVRFGENLFFELIHESDVNQQNHEQLDRIEKEFLEFCCTLLERLSYLDLDETFDSLSCSNNSAKDNRTNMRNSIHLAHSICGLMRKLKPPYTMFKNYLWWNSNYQLNISIEEHKQYVLAKAVYLYLTFLKSEVAFYFPQVLHPQYVFIFCLPFILTLWKSGNPVHIHKGMELACVAGNRMEPLVLQLSYVNQYMKPQIVMNCSCKVLESAAHIAVQCPTLVLRQRALKFIKQFLDKFEWPDRHYLLLCLLKENSHPGMIGYLIGYFKDKLMEALQTSLTSNKASFFLMVHNLEKFFNFCFNLPEGSETDLLFNYDKIMSSLNLLRFILIRDSTNQTGIVKHLESIKSNFIKPILTATNLSRMHFCDELKNLNKPKGKKNEPALCIDGVNLPSLPLQNRKQTLTIAINNFDVLESLCIRVEELAEHAAESLHP